MTMFSVRSVPRCYKQNKLGVRELLGFSRCELLLLEAGSCGQVPFGNPQEHPPLETATKQQLVKTVTD
jgi:hypothetical protein